MRFAIFAVLLGSVCLTDASLAQDRNGGSGQPGQSIGVPLFHGRPPIMPNVGTAPFKGDDLGNHNARMMLNLNNQRIVNLDRPVSGKDAINLEYLNDAVSQARMVYPVSPVNPVWTSTRNPAFVGDGWPSVTDVNMVAIGMNAKVSDQNAANYGGGIAVGSNARVYGLNGVALGAFARVGGFDGGGAPVRRVLWGVAIGTSANSDAEESVAIGRQAVTAGRQGVAIGAQARAPSERSVALGAGSVTTDPDTLSVGNGTLKRRIANVAAGTDPEDAINLEQLRSAVTNVPRYTGGDGISVNSQNVISVNATVVRTTGNQSVSGTKTFATAPRSQTDPVAASDLVRLSYLDARQTAANYTGTGGITVNNTTRVIGTDGSVVRTTGNQTIAGLKTFSTAPRAGTDPANGSDLVRLSYLNTRLTTELNARSYTAGSGVSISATRVVSVDGTVIRTTGNQSVTGVKTFAAPPRATANPVDGNDLVRLSFLTSQIAGSAYSAGSGVTISAARSVAVDGTVVRTTGNQTLAGLKTFSAAPRAGADPANGSDLVRLSYLNARLSALPSPITYGAGDGILISGSTISVNGSVVRTTGQQFVDGLKIFRAAPRSQVNPSHGEDLVRLSFLNTQLNQRNYTAGSGVTISAARAVAVDATVIRTTGNQSVSGVKTFASPPRATANPVDGNDLVRLSYLSGQLAGRDYTAGSGITISSGRVVAADATVVRTTGNQAVAGIKTFAVPPRASANPSDGNDLVRLSFLTTQLNARNYTSGDGLELVGRQFRANATVVRTTGNQTLAGLKTFSTAPRAATDPANGSDLVRLSYLNTRLTNDLNARNYTGTDGVVINNTSRIARVDSTVVRTSGNQGISGTKQFNDPVRAAVIEATPGGSLSLTSGNSVNVSSNNGGIRLNAGYVGDTTIRSIDLTATGGIFINSGDGYVGNSDSAGAVRMNSGGKFEFINKPAELHEFLIDVGGGLNFNSRRGGMDVDVRSAVDIHTTNGGARLRAGNGNVSIDAENSHAYVNAAFSANLVARGGWANIESGSNGVRFIVGGTIRGTVTATGYQNASDIRLKENVETLEHGMEIISRLRAVTYDWKDGGEHAYGVIAQEVREVMPEAVTEDPETGTLLVNYNEILSPLISAAQELDARVTDLEEENEDMKRTIAAFERRFEALEAGTAR